MVLAVEVRRLTKIYPGKVKALDGIDLDIDEGCIYALLGPNGAGKTTLIRIVTTQIRQTYGYVKVFGYNTSTQGSSVRSLIGYVPQEMSLWSELTGYENMLIYSKIYGIPSSIRRKTIEELLDFMDLREASNRMVRTYSGGMIRRLEISIALMHRPRLLVLDEPTIGLDPAARKFVWEKIVEYRKDYNMTIFFATHYMDEADRYADYIALMNRGVIVARGKPEELKHNVNVDRITLKIAMNISGALSILSRMEGITILEVNGDTIEFSASSASRTLPKILEELFKNDLKVYEIKIREATLDDVFIKLTGRKLSEKELGRYREIITTRKMIRRGLM
ncbi:MAG: ABC transporter ATP-binding protein [Ignisphaera sp.]|nr:ABC transporter ATP-binding protein [Ignisphaera sp.]MCX8167767.1 ABC transporter ATP-binding protein [Ignisphaera sp.]MDW8085246.1 ABC transporter ATP-binding protein [Ignisphaera sp.]